MLGEEGEHVVEEGDAGTDISLALAVQIEAEGDLRFFGMPFDGGKTRFHRED